MKKIIEKLVNVIAPLVLELLIVKLEELIDTDLNNDGKIGN